jgi:hypothetical protein
LPSTDLSGPYWFQGTKTGALNTSFLNIDTDRDLICVAGQAQDSDRLAYFNRTVTFTYASRGNITKETTQKVTGQFPTEVLLTLEIQAINESEPEYEGEATVECKLKASLLKAGARDKVNLVCDLGENLSEFSPALTPEEIQNVANAYGPGKRVRVKTKKGKLKLPSAGVRVGDDAELPLSCDLGT